MLLVSAAPALTAVFHITIADVTTRAFSVDWVSNEPVTTVTVRVFSDAHGATEITSNLSVTLVSTLFPPALEQGIVKVSVTSLPADTSVFVQTVITSANGTVAAPTAPPFLEGHTAAKTVKTNARYEPIVNDRILHRVFLPTGTESLSEKSPPMPQPGSGTADKHWRVGVA
jgi:hypothetical protein